MSKLLTHLADLRADPMNWLAALVFFTSAFFLTLKSTATTSLFLMFFICSWSIVKAPRYYFAAQGPQFWVLILCLLAPFLAEVLAQVGRGSFIGSSLDGPSRAILAAGVFIYLSKKDCTKLLSALGIGSALGIVLVFLHLQVFPEHYWGDRAATYFVDPITLPCYAVVLLGLYLFGDYPKIPKKISYFVTLLISILTIYVAIESQSRSSWVAGLGIFIAYILYRYRSSLVKQTLGMLTLMFACLMVFNLSDVVGQRSVDAAEGVIDFVRQGGGQESSAGQRMTLFLVDFELLKDNLLFGIDDGVMPTYESLKSIIPTINEEIYKIKTLAGSHSEYSAQLVRKGIFLGSFAIWGLFLYPIYLVMRFYFTKRFLGCGLKQLLGVVVPISLVAGTIQVFNLKMTISFYVMLLAIMFASHHYENRRPDIKT
jgi:O-antigen ligase